MSREVEIWQLKTYLHSNSRIVSWSSGEISGLMTTQCQYGPVTKMRGSPVLYHCVAEKGVSTEYTSFFLICCAIASFPTPQDVYACVCVCLSNENRTDFPV